MNVSSDLLDVSPVDVSPVNLPGWNFCQQIFPKGMRIVAGFRTVLSRTVERPMGNGLSGSNVVGETGSFLMNCVCVYVCMFFSFIKIFNDFAISWTLLILYLFDVAVPFLGVLYFSPSRSRLVSICLLSCRTTF